MSGPRAIHVALCALLAACGARSGIGVDDSADAGSPPDAAREQTGFLVRACGGSGPFVGVRTTAARCDELGPAYPIEHTDGELAFHFLAPVPDGSTERTYVAGSYEPESGVMVLRCDGMGSCDVGVAGVVIVERYREGREMVLRWSVTMESGAHFESGTRIDRMCEASEPVGC